MLRFQFAPLPLGIAFLLLTLPESSYCQYGQGSPQQQVQGSYPNPNMAQIPFQTINPSNPFQRTDRYPFLNPSLGNPGVPNPNSISNSINNNNLQQQNKPGNSWPAVNNLYPNFPNFPFQTIQPGQGQPQIDRNFNTLNSYNPYKPKPRIEMPKIRVIEFPSSEFFEYGGGKLVYPKRPNSDLYVGGREGDVPVTSKVFIECTGPNQVEWLFNSSSNVKRSQLSVITKNFQITRPDQRLPSSGSREYTYLRLGLEESISEKNDGIYICKDRVLPQNYISIRIHVEKQEGTGRPNYPFHPKDTKTISYSRTENLVVIPCKDTDATISLHKHEKGKLSCPLDVFYDPLKGFIIETRNFDDLRGRYVCVGDFNSDLKLMKYNLVPSEDFATRYVEGDAQNIISLGQDSHNKSWTSESGGETSNSPAVLAKAVSIPKTVFSGITLGNSTTGEYLDPRSEFEIEADADESASALRNDNVNLNNVNNNNNERKVPQKNSAKL